MPCLRYFYSRIGRPWLRVGCAACACRPAHGPDASLATSLPMLQILPYIWSYAYTTTGLQPSQVGLSQMTIAGCGVGLAISRTYGG